MSDREVDIQLAPGRVVNVDDFVDITGQTAEEIRPEADGWFRVRFPEDITPEQATRIRIRAMSDTPQAEQFLIDAYGAVANNNDFAATTVPQLASGVDQILAAPTSSPQEKNLASGIKMLGEQVLDLTNQVNALIRIATRTDGT